MFESYILQKVKELVLKLVDWYKNSTTERILQHVSGKTAIFCSESAICRYMSKNEKISDAWKDSLFFRLIDGLITFVISLLKRLYSGVSSLADSSISGIIYKSFIKPLGKLSTTAMALSCMLTGMLVMNIIITWYNNALTARGFILRAVLLLVISLPAWIDMKRLAQAIGSSLFVRAFKWMIDV